MQWLCSWMSWLNNRDCGKWILPSRALVLFHRSTHRITMSSMGGMFRFCLEPLAGWLVSPSSWAGVMVRPAAAAAAIKNVYTEAAEEVDDCDRDCCCCWWELGVCVNSAGLVLHKIRNI